MKEEEDSMNKNGTSNNKWAPFTYVSKETKFITKLLNNTNVSISYTATNNIEKLLVFKQQECIDKYGGNGIYALKCPDFGKRCVGQTECHLQLDLRKTSSHIRISIKIPNSRNILKSVIILLGS